MIRSYMLLFFFFNDTATTEIYTLSLHDALPISPGTLTPSSYPTALTPPSSPTREAGPAFAAAAPSPGTARRSEEHTSELQSLTNLVCRLLLEKKKKITTVKSIRVSVMLLTSLAT